MNHLPFTSLVADNSDTLKSYFEFVLNAERSGEMFSVDFDLVWPLAYSTKGHAKRALVRDFFEGEDFTIRLTISGKPDMTSLEANQQPEEIRLTPKCLEFFIARKVRSIFEIYRQCRIAVTSAPPLRPLPPSQDTRALERALVEYIAANDSFTGTPMELLLELTRFVPDAHYRAAGWPRNPQVFGCKIDMIAPALLSSGIELTRGKSGGRRIIRIRRQMKQLSR